MLLVGTILGGWSSPLFAQDVAPARQRRRQPPRSPRRAAGRAPPSPGRSARSRSAAPSGSSRRPSAPMPTSSPGQTYTAETLDTALKDLYATELFADVVITGADTGNLVIKVRENPVINRIVLEGNKRIKDDKIQPEIRLAPRQIFTRSKVRADVERIIELYKRAGPLRGDGRAQDRPARPEPRRPGVRDQRGRQVQGPRDQHHRQRAVRRRPAAQGNVHPGSRRPARLLQVQRQLRSRPPGRRPAEAARFLPDRRAMPISASSRRSPS